MRLVALAAAAIGTIIGTGAALAQNAASFPEREVRLIVPLTPGGISDFFGRFVAEHLQEKWGQPVVVENIPGGGTTIGMAALAEAAPDGYTIGLGNIASHSINPALMSNVPYDAVEDFAPVAMVAETANFLVVNPENLPEVKTVADLVEYAKAHPGEINFASTSVGGSTHIAMELLMWKAGVDMVHVPFQGTAPSLTALLSGEVDVASTDPGTARPHIEAGKLVLLGSYATERTDIDPDVPTVNETVPGVVITTWNGILAPAGTPEEIVKKISDDIRAFLMTDEAKAELNKRGAWPIDITPEQFRERIAAEVETYKQLGEEAGIELQ